VLDVDGHDIGAIREAFAEARAAEPDDRPTFIHAHTAKGHGVSFTELTIAWHTGGLSDEQLATALAELHAEEEPK
jgi:transketolase